MSEEFCSYPVGNCVLGASMQAEIDSLKRQEEGAKIAYQNLINSKSEIQSKMELVERLYRDAVEQIRSQHADKAALRERVGFLISCVRSGEQLGSREDWVMEVLK